MTLVLLSLAAAATASADGVTLTFNGGGNYTMGGVYVGPYNFTATTSGGQTYSLQLVCDTFQNEVFGGEQWTANTSVYPSLTNVMFTGPDSAAGYAEIAWLVQQMFGNLGNAQTVGDIAWAIWDVFDPGISNNDPYGTISPQDQTNINNWLALAILNDPPSNSELLTIYTPVTGSQVPFGDGPPQEYFGVPEPGTWLLLGAGLISLTAMRRRLSY